MKFLHCLLVGGLIATNASYAQSIPNWEVEDIDGNTHSVYDILESGRVLFIDFFYYSCAPCNASMPAVEEMYDKLGPNGEDIVEVWSMDVNNEYSLAQAWRTNYHLTNPVFNNMIDEYWQVSAGTGIPAFFTICPDKNVFGARGWSLPIFLFSRTRFALVE